MVKYEFNKNNVIIKDIPINMICFFTGLFLFVLIFFIVDKILFKDFILFILPLFLGSFFLKQKTTIIYIKNGNVYVIAKHFLFKKKYRTNIKKANITISYGQGNYKHNGVILINDVSITTPDFKRPFSNDLEPVLEQLKKLI